jgi:hypothetical protein
MYRRQLVAGLAATIPFLAGCTTLFDGGSDDGSQSTSDSSTTTSTPTTAGTTAGETTPTARTQTATTTSTAIPTPTVTSTLTSPSTPARTAESTQGTETVLIDLSNLVTYTSNTYPYSMKYPASWRVDRTPSDPERAVVFFAPSGDAQMQVNIGQIQGSASLKQVVKNFTLGYKRSVRQDGGTVNNLERRNVTLPNGHRAIVLNTLSTGPSDKKLRGVIVLTQNNGILYTVSVIMFERSYPPTVERGVNAILTSLTISPTKQ